MDTSTCAVILAIGDELTLGQTVDTNSAWLSARLIEQGILTAYHATVPDDLDAITRAVQDAARAAPLVLITCGLGPTEDDLTRDALAQAADAPLAMHQPSLERLHQFFLSINRPMPERNRVQALCPKGAEMLENDRGTAPGIRMSLARATVVAMPGVPHEMKAMYERHVAPRLTAQSGRVILTEAVHTFGIGESQVAAQLGDLMQRGTNPQVGTTVSAGIVTVRVRSEFADRERAQFKLKETLDLIGARLGDAVFGLGTMTLQEAVARLLRDRQKTVVTAESCTGGLVAKLLTDVAGSSAYFRGGWVVYANDLKERELQVPHELLATHGSVSEPVARALAEHAIRKGLADFALAITGIAGPDGGTPEKPVGTVWIAVAENSGGGIAIRAVRRQFPGLRDLVRERAAKTALNDLRLAMVH